VRAARRSQVLLPLAEASTHGLERRTVGSRACFAHEKFANHQRAGTRYCGCGAPDLACPSSEHLACGVRVSAPRR
jgi:hypothetical protein